MANIILVGFVRHAKPLVSAEVPDWVVIKGFKDPLPTSLEDVAAVVIQASIPGRLESDWRKLCSGQTAVFKVDTEMDLEKTLRGFLGPNLGGWVGGMFRRKPDPEVLYSPGVRNYLSSGYGKGIYKKG